MTLTLSTVIDFVSTLAILTLLTNSYGWFRRSIPGERLMQYVLGALFGFVAVLMMNMHLELTPGVVIDLRVIPVILAGAYLGWRGTLVCVVIAAGMRFHIGGVGMPSGVAVVGLTGMLGLVWSRGFRDRDRHGWKVFLLLGVLASASAATAVLLPHDVALWFLSSVTPILTPIYLVLVPLYAMLMEREDLSIWTERMLRASATTDPKTGLLTPEAFERAVSNVAADGKASQGSGLVVLRLRHARWICEVHGEDALDAILGALRVRLESILQRGDLMAATRSHGMVAMLLDRDADTLAGKANAIAHDLGTRPIRLGNGDTLRVSLDVGSAWDARCCDLDAVMAEAVRNLEANARSRVTAREPEGRNRLTDMLFDKLAKHNPS